MNPHVKLATVNQADISPAEWQARLDLAATYRLIAHYGWGDVIYNHSSMRVPGEERKFLIKRHELALHRSHGVEPGQGQHGRRS